MHWHQNNDEAVTSKPDQTKRSFMMMMVHKLRHGFQCFQPGFMTAVAASVVLFLSLLVSGTAFAATTIIRPDGVNNPGSWSGVTAANLSDQNDASFATGSAGSIFTVSLANGAAYATADNINSVTIWVRAKQDTAGSHQIDFGPAGALSGSPQNVSQGVFSNYSYTPAGPFTINDVDNLEIDVQNDGTATFDVAEVWVVVDFTNSNAITTCDGCHQDPPIDGASRNSIEGAVVGSHEAHNDYTCTICHPNNSVLNHRGAGSGDTGGQIEMLANIEGGTYGKGIAFTQANDLDGSGLALCSNVNCHNGIDTPVWGNNGTLGCDGCHSLPPNTNAHTSHYTAKGWTTGVTTNCTACHPDNETAAGHSNVIDNKVEVLPGLTPSGTSPAISCGTAPALGCHNGAATPNWDTINIGCLDCHTVGSLSDTNPVSGLHDEIPTVSGVQHDNTIDALGCQACHDDGTGKPSATHVDGTADTPGDFSPTGITVGYSAGSPPTCAADCHFENGTSGLWQRKWHDNSDQTDSTECAGCHGDWINGWNGNVLHRTDADPQTTHGTGTNYQCKDCHGLEASAGYAFTIATNDWGAGSNHGDANITINQNGHTFGRNGTGLSGCAPCHAQYDGTDGAADQHSFATTGWNLALINADTIDAGCNTCHGDAGTGQYWPNGSTYPDRAGRHQKHMEQLAARLNYTLATATDAEQKQMCTYCHADPGGSGHSTDSGDQIADVGPYQHIGDASADTGSWNTTDQTCAVACHNTKLTAAGDFGWRDATTSTCTMCHTIAGGGAVDPNSGLHAITPTVSGQQHDDNLTACTTCHDSLPVMSTTSTHINNDTATTDSRGTFAPYTDGSPGSCLGGITGNIGCHDGAGEAGTWARKWSASISGASDGSTECAGCHGGFANDWTFSGALAGNVDHPRDWDAALSSNDGPEVMANHDGTDLCTTCHAYPGGTYSIAWGGPNHGNNAIDMNSNLNYDDTTFSCGTNCHNEAWGNAGHNMEDSLWNINSVTGPALDCRGCHAGTGTGASLVSVNSTHSTNTLPGAPTCESCHFNAHPSGTGGGDIEIAWDSRTMGTDYTVYNTIFLRPYTHASLGTSTNEAQTCWYCHDENGISEWGKTWGAYETGTLTGGPSWVGASWSSAKFNYKTGTIQSVHETGLIDATTMSPTRADVLTGTTDNTSTDEDNIRCTSCHDVHSLSTGDVSALAVPYLRGSWQSNPFREDGAPRDAANAGTDTYNTWGTAGSPSRGSLDRGNVPRGGALSGSTTNNEYGGWQIEQNNNLTYTGTYDAFGGLCQNCHTQGNLETAWNGHRSVVSGFAGGTEQDIFDATTRGAAKATGNWSSGGLMAHNYNYTWIPNAETRDTKGRVGGLRNNRNVTSGGAGTGDGIPPLMVYVSGTGTGFEVNFATGSVQTLHVGSGVAQANFHNFPCAKCHNPHASRLPRLMITNCLDVSHNTWDDNKNPSSWGAGTYDETELAYSPSAANCHRRDATNPGWNDLTPW